MSLDKKTVTVDKNDAGERLDRYVYLYLKKHLPTPYNQIISRSFVTSNYSYIATIAKSNPKAAHILKEGNLVVIDLALVKKLLNEEAERRFAKDRIVAEEGSLNILEETAEYLLIDKPAGMVMHPGTGNSSGTLANVVKGYLLKKGELDKNVERAGIVHRLDKGVSGLVIVAKTREYQLYLKKLFEQHRVTKVYVASVVKVEGTYFTQKLEELLQSGLYIPKEVLTSIRNKFPQEDSLPWLRVEGFIGRNPKNRYINKFTLKKPLKGTTRRAISYFLPIGDDLIAIKIETGRMHQIRATLKRMGYQIVGDPLYGTAKQNEISQDIKLRSRIIAYLDLDNSVKSWLID